MIKIQFQEMSETLLRILLKAGMDALKAKRCADIFTQNTCDGVSSHGVNRFPRFVEHIQNGTIDINAEAVLANSLGAIEQWDGNRGIGPLNAEVAMGRALSLARTHGLGCVGLRNTNHWMRGGTYGLQAADAGCVALCWTNTIALMPPWGGVERKIGNNPMVISVPRADNHVLLDMALSQFSNGKLEVLQRRGEQLPMVGGYNSDGELTTDPQSILESFRGLPIGFWKGSGLAFVLDLMAALITGGDATKDLQQRGEETGVSQVFLAIDVAACSAGNDLDEKVTSIIQDFISAEPVDQDQPVRYPGQGMFATREQNLAHGIPVDCDLWQEILSL